MDDLLNKILTNTYTTQSLHHRLSFLKDYFSAKFYSQQGLVFAQTDLEWLQSLGECTGQFNRENLNDWIIKLQKQAETLERLTTYFAVDLPEENVRQVAKFIRENFKQGLLVDVKIDPSLIAGCALVYKGVYKDYSLKKTIENQKTQVLEQFKLFLS